MVEIRPGLFWARIPLPFRLNHVNVYLLDDGDGWTIVDCGVEAEACRDAWDRLHATALAGKPVRRIVVTHGHTDHIGIAGRLARRHDLPVTMSREEWLAAQHRYADRDRDYSPEVRAVFGRWGCGQEDIDLFAKDRRWMSSHVGEPPALLEAVDEGDVIRMGGRDWTILKTGGHAPAHLAFHCEQESLLLGGDQILPSITPAILVDAAEPDGGPLDDFLRSLRRFAALPEETLVCPGHGRPFARLHARIAALEAHHRARLAETWDALVAQPSTALDVTGRLFPKASEGMHRRHALTETVAHLNHLVRRQAVACTPDGPMNMYEALGARPSGS